MTFIDDVANRVDKAQVVATITSILDRSWSTFEGYTSPLGIGFMCSGCGGWPTTIGCAPKTLGLGPGPYGWECPQSQHADSFHPWGHPSPGNGWPGGQEDGHQAWHYFVDACNMYQTQNSSTDGLGCDHTIHGTGYPRQPV
eukprot:COSAG02_NODE_7432_length_3015_cov_6.358025_2_plen_141_part_00